MKTGKDCRQIRPFTPKIYVFLKREPTTNEKTITFVLLWYRVHRMYETTRTPSDPAKRGKKTLSTPGGRHTHTGAKIIRHPLVQPKSSPRQIRFSPFTPYIFHETPLLVFSHAADTVQRIVPTSPHRSLRGSHACRRRRFHLVELRRR